MPVGSGWRNGRWCGFGVGRHPGRRDPWSGGASWSKLASMTRVATIYGMSMMRTTVYLTQEAKHLLTLAARRQHRSEAELIREAIDRLLLAEPARPAPELPVFDDLDASLPDQVDEVLAAGFGADGFSWDDTERPGAASDH